MGTVGKQREGETCYTRNWNAGGKKLKRGPITLNGFRKGKGRVISKDPGQKLWGGESSKRRGKRRFTKNIRSLEVKSGVREMTEGGLQRRVNGERGNIELGETKLR